jgi:TATA-box binding protein (TBP) (component of TFIID and TFIIIB)
MESYKISTITANGSINCRINLDLLFENILIDDKFIWIQYNKMEKGEYPKKRKKVEGKTFDNQAMVYYKLSTDYRPNIKLFKNGNIHMTGLRCTDDGHKLINIVSDEVKRIYNTDIKIVEDIKLIVPGNFIVRMFNSGFVFPFEIRRKSLHNLLISEKYENICSFEPLSYPGVKLQYFYNIFNSKRNGQCYCDTPCFGKGNGLTKNNCKKITVAVFESGSTIITGANMIEQIDESYKYIKTVVLQNEDGIKKLINKPS